MRKLTVIFIFAILFSIPNCSNSAPITDCDKLAASPTDPQRKTPGVLPDDIDSVAAIPACITAVHQYPNDARLNFQLGRAYYKAQKFKTAADEFKIAAEKGYAAAQFNLGLMYEYGQGVSQNYGEALIWYRKAAEQGDENAKSKLDEFL
jgi:tetratricopeptide (TPR) repeat protein